MPSGTVAYEKMPNELVTAISLQAAILYGITIGLAIILGPMKEILSFLVASRKNVPKGPTFRQLL